MSDHFGIGKLTLKFYSFPILELTFQVHHLISYEVAFDRTETILGDDDKFMKFYDYRVRKFNHSTSVISGTYEQLLPTDDTLYGIVSFMSWTGGQYKKIWDTRVEPFCTALHKPPFDSYMKKFLESSDKPGNFNSCPMPAGNYTIKNFGGDASFLPDRIPGGDDEKWLVKQAVYNRSNDELLGGQNIYLYLRSNESDYMYGKK